MTKRNAAVSADAATARFERLFRDHHVAVVAYVRRRAPQEAVDDIVGETFLVAWRRLGCVPRRGASVAVGGRSQRARHATARSGSAPRVDGSARADRRWAGGVPGRRSPGVGRRRPTPEGPVEACAQGPRGAYVDRLGRLAAAGSCRCSRRLGGCIPRAPASRPAAPASAARGQLGARAVGSSPPATSRGGRS